MARKYEVTNLAKGPRGFHTTDRGEVVIARHETEVISVTGGVEKMLLAMVESREVEANDLGAVDSLDHDGDGKKGGTKKAIAEVDLNAKGGEAAKALDEARKALEAESERADKAEAELEALKEPKTYEVGDYVAGIMADAGVENFSDLQPVLDAIEERIETLTGITPEDWASIKAGLDDVKAGRVTEVRGTDGASGPAADAETIANAGAAEYAPSLDFETLDEEQLRGFLKAAEVTFHPQTGKAKLVEKALAADRTQWDEAQAALSKTVAPAPDAPAESDEAV